MYHHCEVKWNCDSLWKIKVTKQPIVFPGEGNTPIFKMMDKLCRENPFCVPVLAESVKCVAYFPVAGLQEGLAAFVQNISLTSGIAQLVSEHNRCIANKRKEHARFGSPG